jgi:hypothetical protein
MSLRDTVETTLIQPNYLDEITSFLHGRGRWRTIGMIMETTSKIMLGAGSVLSFASSVYTDQRMSFISGTLSTVSLVCLQFASYSFHESKRSTEHLNVLLQSIEVGPLPEIVDINRQNDSTVSVSSSGK